MGDSHVEICIWSAWLQWKQREGRTNWWQLKERLPSSAFYFPLKVSGIIELLPLRLYRATGVARLSGACTGCETRQQTQRGFSLRRKETLKKKQKKHWPLWIVCAPVWLNYRSPPLCLLGWLTDGGRHTFLFFRPPCPCHESETKSQNVPQELCNSQHLCFWLNVSSRQWNPLIWPQRLHAVIIIIPREP